MAFARFRWLVMAFPLALILSSCTDFPSLRAAGNLPFAEYPLEMHVGGYDGAGEGRPKNVNEFNSADQFRNVLSQVDEKDCPPSDSLRDCLKLIRNQSRTDQQAYNGVSGITGRTFLRVAQSAVAGSGFKNPEVKIKGQIQEFCLHDTDLPGYAYNAADRSMRLCVLMTTTIKDPGSNESGLAPVRDPATLYQYFHIEVRNDVAVDDGAGGSAVDVFPTAASQTGIVIDDAKVNSFSPPMNHKLYAWGRAIRIVTYWETATATNGMPIWNPNLKFARKPNGSPPHIPPGTPDRKAIQDYFNEDKDACLDMMFNGPPPPVLDPAVHVGGISYCLGRCKNPPVVNTR